MKIEITIAVVVDTTRNDQLGTSNDGLGFGFVIGVGDGDSIIIGIRVEDGFELGGNRAHFANIALGHDARPVEVATFMVDVLEVQLEGFEIAFTRRFGGGGGVVVFDETCRSGIGDGYCGVREMGNGGSGFTFAIVTKLVEGAINDTIIKVAKSVVPIRLFGKVKVKDLGVPQRPGAVMMT